MTKKRASQKPAEPENICIDGTLRFTIRADGIDRPMNLDLIVARMVCERCEDKHKLQAVNGMLAPTPEFIKDLGAELSQVCGETISPTVAFQIWPHVNASMLNLKKNMNSMPN